MTKNHENLTALRPRDENGNRNTSNKIHIEYWRGYDGFPHRYSLGSKMYAAWRAGRDAWQRKQNG